MQISMREPPIPPRIKFQGVSAVSVNFGVFRPVCFLGDFFKFFFSLLSTSLISPPPATASQPSLQRSAGQMLLLLLSFAYAVASSSSAVASSSFAATVAASSSVAAVVVASYPDVFFLLLHVCPDCFVSFSFLFYLFIYFFFTILFCVAFILPSLQSNFFNFQNLPAISLSVSHLQFTNDYLYHFVLSSCRNCQFVMRYQLKLYII